MENENLSKKQLLDEMEEMRKRIAELEKMGAERSRVEETLKASEEKLRRIFESVKDGIAITDLDGNIVEINKKGLQLGRYTSKSEVIGKNALDTISPSDREKAFKNMMELMETGVVGTEEFKLIKSDGTEYPTEITASLMKDDSGDPVGFVSVIRDITERTRAEEALQESERLLSDSQKNANVGSWEWNLKTGKAVWSEQLYHIYGREIDKGVPPMETYLEAYHPDDRKPLQDAIEGAIKKDKPYKIDYRIFRENDGEERWIRSQGQIEKDANGEPNRLLGIAQDITERKKAEEKLRDAEKKWMSLTENTNDFILIVDNKGRIQYINRAIRPHTIDDVIGKTLYDIAMPEHHETIRQVVEKTFETREQGSYTSNVDHPAGTRWFNSTMIPITEEGKVTCAMIFNKDITDRKLADEALRESEEKFRLLTEQSLLGLVIIQDGLVKYVNQAASDITGYSKEEALDWKPNGFDKLFHPDDLEFVLEQAQKKQKGAKDVITNYQYRIITKSGEVKWVDQYSKTITFRGKTADFITIVDITERKKAEEELIRLSTAVKMSSESVLISDLSGNIIDFNEATMKMYGASTRHELMGESGLDIISPEDRRKAEAITREILEKGYVKNIEYHILRKDGVKIPVEVSASVMRDAKGKPTGIVGISRDITERKRAENEMRRRLMRFDLADGNLYLVKESVPNMSIQVFKDLLKIGYKGTVISRTPIDEFKKAVEGEFEFFWLAEKEKKKSLSPKIKGIQKQLENLSRNNVILIDRLDYIIQKNGFKKTLTFVQHQREISYISGCILILSIDPSTLSSKELRLLDKETREVLPQQAIPLSDDLTEIMKFVYRQNLLGVKPSHTILCRELDISKPTARKRIRNLITTGYIREGQKGRTKVVELTEKGRTIFIR